MQSLSGAGATFFCFSLSAWPSESILRIVEKTFPATYVIFPFHVEHLEAISSMALISVRLKNSTMILPRIPFSASIAVKL